MGLQTDDYTTFKSLNQWVIKPAIKEINDVTDYLVEVDQKRIGRRIGELKFRITRVKELPVQESVIPGYREPSAYCCGVGTSGD